MYDYIHIFFVRKHHQMVCGLIQGSMKRLDNSLAKASPVNFLGDTVWTTCLQTDHSRSEGHWWHRCCSRTARSQSQLLQRSSSTEMWFAARQQRGEEVLSVKRQVWPGNRHFILWTRAGMSENSMITVVSSFRWDNTWLETPTHISLQNEN